MRCDVMATKDGHISETPNRDRYRFLFPPPKVSLKSGLDSARSRIQQACVDIIRASRGGGYGSSPYMAPGAQQQVSMEFPTFLVVCISAGL